MKYFFSTLAVLFIMVLQAQETGSIAGKLTDKDFENEPLPFANVLIKGTAKGATSDIDGLYEISNLEPGSYTVVFSFVGYETQELQANVVSGKVTTINVPMGASAAALEEIVITTTARKDSEAALLLDQKKAVEIKESIGIQEIEKLGVSNAAAATTKIAGVSKSEGGGQIYVRGLGDRYLTTTLNGLPIPSDNIDKKNIDLELFPTRFISSVSISKTFSPNNSADQSSGNIDITSKDITKRKDYGVSFSGGLNTNVESDFKVTAVNDDLSLGIFSRPYQNDNLQNALTQQSWNTQTEDVALNYSIGFNAGGFLDEDGKWRLSFAGGQSVNHEYREGLFRQFSNGTAASLIDVTNGARNFVPDGDNRYWRRTVNTNGMLVAQYKINDNNRLKFNAIAVNKVFEETREAGRAGGAIFFDELTPNVETGNQFLRDQNIKNTFLTIVQLIGSHNINDKNTLDWAIGYNRLAADEPNRIRNELNFINPMPGVTGPLNEREIEFGNTGGFQQNKRFQEILDDDFTGRIKDDIVLKKDEDDNDIYKLSFGADGRYKQREFIANAFGFDETTTGSINPSSIDNLDEVFSRSDVSSFFSFFNFPTDDTYDGELTSYGGFVDFVGVFGKFTAQAGLRFQNDEIFVDWMINNASDGEITKTYDGFYPSLNLKYDLNDKMALRLAGSLSQTLPEFKEIAPFQYVSTENQITQGNPLLERSTNVNVDLKFEFFPSNDEILSVTAYYKSIDEAINRSLQAGGADNVFNYYNTGDARIFGVELEGRMYLIKKRDSLPNLKLSGNVSYIDHIQDLKDNSEGINENGAPRTFQYRSIDEIGLEGASDWTTNLALTLNTGDKHPYEFTLAANYASDRIYALGAPIFQGEDPNNPGVFLEDRNFDGEIIEQGFVVLDFIFRKDINEHLSIGLTAKNLLNPEIKRFQLVASDFGNSTATQEEDVLTYTRGRDMSLSINYKF